ncbi:MAG: 16S rRNA (guanine(966)-N(2))-methyltransferase RsmD [Oscillospiraceae bacterium]|nr:16S rRNA (guanine(966)-N(2))-methyltransferase RsmD [Oscillospiraceae bacterium]
MRVITGTARGKRLKTLDGLDTRPTTDRVKESIFNIVQFDIEGRQVLDLFAGSGQLAIECVSRGALHATAVDLSKAAVKVIAENVRNCEMEDRIHVVGEDYRTFLKRIRKQFDLILMDPPYHTKDLQNALDLIYEFDILTDGGIIVCESARDQELAEPPAPYEKGREYLYGKSKVSVIHKRV